jgi:hypothetical protein
MRFGFRSGRRARWRAVCIWFAGVLLLCGAGVQPAAAFCRESLESQSQGPCEEDPGVPFLFWKRNCMTYRFNQQFFDLVPLLSEAASRQVFKDSFQAWADVACGRRPFFVQQFAGTTATSKAEFLYDVVNESIVVARTKAEWMNLKDHDSTALALTLLWHDKVTGEILDVDMEVNTGAGRFTDCEKQRCTLQMIDLQNTITHEAGHLLGLGHSPVMGSTMEASTQSNPETTKRTLEADDRAGYCALNLPTPPTCGGGDCVCGAPEIVPSRRTIRSCGCSLPGTASSAGAPFAALACALGLGVFARRRRRR